MRPRRHAGRKIAGVSALSCILHASALAAARRSGRPDFVAVTQQGLIYTSGSKLAEHGGFTANDRNVALLVSNPSLAASTNTSAVETRQIAPTILRALGLPPYRLEAVRIEGTRMLPGLMD